jgi:Ca-activated chloride channel homolog
VSFASPLLLLSLAALPVLFASYTWLRRRPGRYSARFPGVPVLAGAVAATPVWRRHIPAAVAALALAALAVALARPHATIAVPVERASVVLVTDASRSMLATDVEPSRMDAARSAAGAFVDGVPDELRVGAVAFSTTPSAVVPPTQGRERIRAHLASLHADGSTATGDALAEALRLLKGQGKQRPPAAIVLLSDGKTTTGRDPIQVARAAGRAKVPIFTVALGTPGATIPNPYPYASPLPVPPDPVTLKRIASESKGRAYTVEDSGELSSIYQRLGSSIGTRKRQQEITAVFAIGGLLLLAGAAAASLRWSGRLP